MGLNDFGFLSRFDISSADARTRVKQLFERGIRHFEFYDCLERYEQPLDPHKSGWKDPLGRLTKRETIDAYLDEINRQRGVSWFYVPVYSVSPDYQHPSLADALFSHIQSTGEFRQEWLCTDNKPEWPLFSLINPSSQAWKDWFIPQLRVITENVGFDGIFFDQYSTLGNRFNYRYKHRDWSWANTKNTNYFKEVEKIELIKDFLGSYRRSVPNPRFLFNAVNGYGFEETRTLVEFPFLELWSEDLIEKYANYLGSRGKYVIANYTPLKQDGSFDWEKFGRKRDLINSRGGSFLFLGDDIRYLTNCYFPSAVKV